MVDAARAQLESRLPVREGGIVAGKYRVDAIIGIGGMGAVVRATHLALAKPVALKFMLVDSLGNLEAVSRFLREARLVAALHSDHVCRVFDVATLDDGAPYIVMELLTGTDLGKRLEAQGPLPPLEAARHVFEACDALAEAHDAGVVHRDVKPANLFLAERSNARPSIKVLDFGISKGTIVGDPSLSATKTSALLGSPCYMSPEQMTAPKDVDARTDIWSFGVVLYELLATGRVPFDADTLGALFLKVFQEPTPPLPSHVPQDLAQVIHRCLEKDRARRFASARELSAALAPIAGLVNTGNHAAAQAQSAPSVPPPTHPSHARAAEKRASFRLGVVSFAVVLFLGVLMMAYAKHRVHMAIPPSAATAIPH